MDRMPYRSWTLYRASTIWMVEQFGLATMPLRYPFRRSPLISGTTSGMAGSMRKADELSMTTLPASAAIGAYCLDTAAPAEKRR